MRLAVLIAAVLVVSLGLGAAGCGGAKDSSDTQAPPTPYPEYRADLEQFEAELETVQSVEGIPTVEGLSEQLESVIERVEAELKRGRQVVPEPCYAAAHEEVIAYGDTSIAALKDALPQLADVETIIAVIPLITALETESKARHPDAYADGTQSTLNILDALATCSSTPE